MTESNNLKTEYDRRHHLRKVALVSFPLMMVGATLAIILLQMSGYAGSVQDTQLGFNADIIKAYFSLMDPAGMGLFIMGNLADYIFILFYGIFFYSTARLISWNYKGGLTKSVGMSLAWVGVIAAVLDGIENLFLFAMTANPAGFPSWLALAHSTFATAKFLFLYAAMGWTVAGFVLNRTPLSGILISGLKAR